MTDGFRKIEKRFETFREKVSQCHEANSTMDDIEDAYSRLYRLRNRYEYERNKRALDPTELAPLRKVFEENNFINCYFVTGNNQQTSKHFRKVNSGKLDRSMQAP